MKDYFSFSKKERIAIAVLLSLTGLFLVLPYYFRQEKEPPAEVNTILTQKDETGGAPAVIPETAKPARTLFVFDPNTISEVQWLQLGLRERTVKTIMNYRNKGGRFRTAEDIRKIWGLKPGEAELLIPYIRIAPAASLQDATRKKEAIPAPAKNLKTYHIPTIRINTATAEEWEVLPGIGPVLSTRIVRFREKLGGFESVQQVSKTYGLSDTVFRLILPYLRLDTAARINER